MTLKPVTVWAVYQDRLCVWSDGDLVAEIPANQWHRLIRDLADQFWSNEAEIKENFIEKSKTAVAARSLDVQPTDQAESQTGDNIERGTADHIVQTTLGECC